MGETIHKTVMVLYSVVLMPVCQPCCVLSGHLEQGGGVSLRWREMMSGKVLGMRLVGYIRGGSTKEVPLGGVLKEKGIPDMKKKKYWREEGSLGRSGQESTEHLERLSSSPDTWSLVSWGR